MVSVVMGQKTFVPLSGLSPWNHSTFLRATSRVKRRKAAKNATVAEMAPRAKMAYATLPLTGPCKHARRREEKNGRGLAMAKRNAVQMGTHGDDFRTSQNHQSVGRKGGILQNQLGDSLPHGLPYSITGLLHDLPHSSTTEGDKSF